VKASRRSPITAVGGNRRRIMPLSPSVLGALLTGIYLMMCPAIAVAAPPCKPVPSDLQWWTQFNGSTDANVFVEYLNRFPGGCYRSEAESKIEALIEDSPALAIEIQLSDDPNWRTASEGEEFGTDHQYIELLRVKSLPWLPIEYTCSSLGQGQTFWARWPAACPQKKAPMQGMAVRIEGPLKDLYALQLKCTVIQMPGKQRTEHVVGNGQWCGEKIGTWKFNSTALQRATLSVKRAHAQ